MSRLTTHVLDTAHGRPGAGIKIDLYRLTATGQQWLNSAITQTDGRCAAPLLEGQAFQSGRYQLDFHIGDYYAGLGLLLPEPRFFDVVSLAIGLADTRQSYHLPLLCSPWSYSTYRGS